jgi:hypothetical protein
MTITELADECGITADAVQRKLRAIHGRTFPLRTELTDAEIESFRQSANVPRAARRANLSVTSPSVTSPPDANPANTDEDELVFFEHLKSYPHKKLAAVNVICAFFGWYAWTDVLHEFGALIGLVGILLIWDSMETLRSKLQLVESGTAARLLPLVYKAATAVVNYIAIWRLLQGDAVLSGWAVEIAVAGAALILIFEYAALLQSRWKTFDEL